MGNMDWSDLSELQWQEIYSFTHVNDRTQAMGSSFGMMTLGGGFEVLTEAMQDYWRLIDFLTTVQQELAIRALQDEIRDLFYINSWSSDSEGVLEDEWV